MEDDDTSAGVSEIIAAKQIQKAASSGWRPRISGQEFISQEEMNAIFNVFVYTETDKCSAES